MGGIVFITQAASERQRENEGWELKENEGGPKEKGVSASFGGQNYMNTLLSQKFAKKPVYFVSARYAFTNQNLKIPPISPNVVVAPRSFQGVPVHSFQGVPRNTLN